MAFVRLICPELEERCYVFSDDRAFFCTFGSVRIIIVNVMCVGVCMYVCIAKGNRLAITVCTVCQIG